MCLALGVQSLMLFSSLKYVWESKVPKHSQAGSSAGWEPSVVGAMQAEDHA